MQVLLGLNFCTRCSKVSTTNSEPSAGLMPMPFCWLKPPGGGGWVMPMPQVPASDQVQLPVLSAIGVPAGLYL